MTAKKQLFCRLVDGNLIIPDQEKEWARFFFAQMKKEYIVITIEEFKEDDYEVTKMRRYYFGVIVRLWKDYSGYTVKEMDYLLRSLFLSYKLTLRDSGEKDIVKSLQDGAVTRESMNKFLNSCIDFSNANDVKIPTPDEIEKDPTILTKLSDELKNKKYNEDTCYFQQIFSPTP